MLNLPSRFHAMPRDYWKSFSFVGLAIATLFFAASLTPSLLPRHFAVQGILSGFAAAVGYGVGVFFVRLWLFLEIPEPSSAIQRLSKRVTTIAVAVVVILFLWRATTWQNSIRQLMEMDPVPSAYPLRVAMIAAVTGALLIASARALGRCWVYLHRRVNQVVPRRISLVASTAIVIVALVLIANDVLARLALNAADSVFRNLDKVVEDGIDRPIRRTAAGSADSLVSWDSIGRWGKEFLVAGPTREEISAFLGNDAMQPLRVYVGLNSRKTIEERAKLALQELERVGGFSRSVLVVATPTGTGWLDPGAVDTLEYLHAGDTAIVSMQYSYLPSWMTILVDPLRSRDSAKALFDAVYDYWRTLPRDNRPKFYVHGLSLGSLGSESSADLFTVFEDPINGGLWSGPPFPSAFWARATAHRNHDSPMWLPKSRDGSMLRFTGRENSLPAGGTRWGPMRFVYIQHASDPMTFFAPNLLYRSPEWLAGQRGPDVSPYLRWYPIVTFLQTGFDLPMATNVPVGYGHNYAPESYIDAWVAVTDPPNWNDANTKRLKELFAKAE